MAGISGFIKKGVDGDKVTKSLKLLGDAKGNNEKRKIESSLLKPNNLPAFTGEKAHGNVLKEKTIAVFFRKKKDMDLFCKHTDASTLPGRRSTYKVEKIIALLKYLDAGKIIYNEEKNSIEEKGTPAKRQRRNRN